MNFSGYNDNKKPSSRGGAPDAYENHIFGTAADNAPTSHTSNAKNVPHNSHSSNTEALANKNTNQQQTNIFGNNSNNASTESAQQQQHNKPHYQQKRTGYNPITGELYNDESVLSLSDKTSSRGNAPTYTKTW